MSLPRVLLCFMGILFHAVVIDGNSVLTRNQRFAQNELLDANDRLNYHDLIQSIWNGVVRSSPEQINDQCVDIVNTVLLTTMDCSKKLAVTEQLMKLLFSQASVTKLTKTIVKVAKKSIEGWMEASKGERVYQACLNTAKLQWRSPIEIALLDL